MSAISSIIGKLKGEKSKEPAKEADEKEEHDHDHDEDEDVCQFC